MKIIQMKWVLVAILIACSLDRAIFASACQIIVFHGNNFSYSYSICAGADGVKKAILGQARKQLPLALGVYMQSSYQLTPISAVDAVCGGSSYKYLKIGNREIVNDRKKQEHSDRDVIALLAREMGIQHIIPIYKIKCFSVQLAYIPKKDCADNLKSFSDKMIKKRIPSTIEIDGEVEQYPIWIQHYLNGLSGIRYGIYLSYNEAIAALRLSKIPLSEVQIIPFELDIQRIETYFY